MQHDVSYDGYQNMVTQVNTGLVQLETLCSKLNMDKSKEALLASRRKLAAHHFSVGILGEFKRGKSTVINSLLGEEIMPADILPCSATMNRVTYDMKPHAKLIMVDGTVKEIEVSQLTEYVTKLTREQEAVSATVEEAVVYYPCQFCQNGVDIVDTPGLNDDDRMTKITENVIPKLDAIIMVLTYDSPFSMSEAEFVRSKLMTSDISKLVFLVNKMDLVRRVSDKQRVLEEIKKKIQRAVLEKTAQLYGENSKEYETAAQKLTNVKVLPFSAVDALDGKLDGDMDLVKRSGTVEFEELLTRMLTQERGAIELGTPLNLMIRTAEDICQTAKTHKTALTLSGKEFLKKQQDALAEIRSIREKKQDETNRLKESAANNKKSFFSQIKLFYAELETRLIAVVDQVEISVDSLKAEDGKQNIVEKMQAEVSEEMRRAMAEISEKVVLQLREIAGAEGIRIGEFINGASVDLRDCMDSFSAGQSSSTLKAFGAEAAVWAASGILGGYLPGLGGLIEGYKVAGVKGAVVGGVSSAVLGTAAMALAMSTFSVVGLPLALIGAVVGSVTGKSITKILFPDHPDQRTISNIRKKMADAVHQMVDSMRTSQELENWVSQRVEICFDELISAMEHECEKLLCDTEYTMDAIQQEIGQDEANRTHLEKQYDEFIALAQKVIAELQPTADKVFDVLAQV